MAYRILKAHVVDSIKKSVSNNPKSAFQYFEAGYLRNRLIDHELLQRELNALAEYFSRNYNGQFCLQTLQHEQK